MHPQVLHQPVHFVEERGNLLDLVDDDLAPTPVASGLQLLAQELRAGRVAPELVALQQVDPALVPVVLPQEGALARLARSPQEERLRAARGAGRVTD